ALKTIFGGVGSELMKLRVGILLIGSPNVGAGTIGLSRLLCVQEQPTGGVRPNASENGQIKPLDHRSGCPRCR
ncbi:MAG: hypothetical protein WBV76_03840, partial [Pseudolabrys sp.]